ncbi:RteC protein [Aequorivita sublithincola DSM 14238]|uniref:RteC protein n=1 Tax=Aequorivita sublithincola (strain DSM 14238 / LMG 21431 / ACAM 643 / 9-3) TaxID=746697 RepID=I3YZU7_AEQSU|nr:RteC domain-containing protein [Aequorivita sublithincola]AFL82515.1 RteC protein [Aequorivita sublithincola DSM 14238]
MKRYLKFQEKLELELESINFASNTIFAEVERGISLCKDSLTILRKVVLKNGFKNIEEECYFFKTIKPIIMGKLIFYIELASVEKNKPRYGKKFIGQYLRMHINSFQSVFLEHHEFYEYFIQKRTDRDLEYFSRANGKISLHIATLSYCTDADFSTSHDLLTAKFIAHELLIEHFANKLDNINQNPSKNSLASTLKWTGTKVDLVELIYALHSSGLVNNGQATLNDLATIFQTLFQKDLGDFYRTFLEIRLRKTNQSKLLDKLKDSLLRKIVEADD